MRYFIFILALLMMGMNSAAHAQDEILTPEIIFHKFPMCKFTSSIRMWCKVLSKEDLKNFSPSKLAGASARDGFDIPPKFVSNIKFSSNELHIVMGNDEWYHTFTVKNLSTNSFEVKWEDDGGEDASYHAVSYFKVVYDNQTQNWKILAESSIAFNSVGQATEESKELFDPPIVFLK